jgi:hypothetical protein
VVQSVFYSIGYVTFCERPRSAPVESGLQSGALHGRSQNVTIPDAVKYNCDLLKMSILLLETCRDI